MSDYWENRAAWDMYHAMEDAERTAQKIARIYRKTLTQLTYAVRDVFDKYRKDYGLSEVEAWELLNKMQKRENKKRKTGHPKSIRSSGIHQQDREI